jgi:hypothetical protein
MTRPEHPDLRTPPPDNRATPAHSTLTHRRDPNARPQRQERHDHPAARARLTSTPFDTSHLVPRQATFASLVA